MEIKTFQKLYPTSPTASSSGRDSLLQHKLNPTITTHFDSSTQNAPVNEHRFYLESDGVRQSDRSDQSIDTFINRGVRWGKSNENDSISDRFNSIQQKSTRLLNKFPDIHNKIIRTQSFSTGGIDLGFLTHNSSAYGNKLKIIKDLEEKITQLESNINNPNIGQEYMRTIEKEINLNFQNYYNQIKENPIDTDQGNKSVSSDDSLEDIRQNKLNAKLDKEKEQQTYNFENKKTKGFFVNLFTPDMIEVETPVNIDKTKDVFLRNKIVEELGKNVDHNCLQQEKKSSGSIQNIINEINEKQYEIDSQEELEKKQIITFRINEVEYEQGCLMNERDDFHLPLDSFERSQNNSTMEEKDKINLLKKTDRSNMSSTNSEIQKIRDDIWNKEYLEFNQQHLSLVKQNQQRSQDHQQLRQFDEERESHIMVIEEKVATLLEQNIKLKEQLNYLRTEFSMVTSQAKEWETKNIELQIQFLQQADKIDQVLQENKEVSNLLTQARENIFKKQKEQKQLCLKMQELQKQLQTSLHKYQIKQNDFHQLLKVIGQKSQQLQQASKMNEQIKHLLYSKQMDYQAQANQYQNNIHQLKEEIHFYKGKLQEQGINLKLQEASYIKDIIEKKDEEDKQKWVTIENKYKQIIVELKEEKICSKKQIQQLKDVNKKLSQFAPKEQRKQIDKQIQEMFFEYDNQLIKKDQQIIQLKKLSEQYKKVLTANANPSDLQVLDNIKAIIVKQKICRQNVDEDYLQLVLIIDKLIRYIKLYGYNLEKEKQERVKLTKKLTTLNLYVNRQLQKSQEKYNKLEQDAKRYKQLNYENSQQMKRMSAKLGVYRSKLGQNGSKLCHNVYQLENQFLQIQNNKLIQKYNKVKKYSMELEQKMVQEFIKNGSNICQHLCSYIQNQLNQNKRNDEVQEEHYNRIVSQIKQEYNRSVICPSEIEPQHQSKSKKNTNLRIKQGVFFFINRPHKNTVAPLPPLLLNPPTPISLTLDKLLHKKSLLSNPVIRSKLVFKLFDLGIELVKVSKKLFSLKPCQMLVNNIEGDMQIILRREYGNSMEEDQNSMVYRAPQVLLGFNESESSYVWTIGLLIDQIFHDKMFYRKMNEILSHKNNYFTRNNDLPIKPVLQKMLKKGQKERPTLHKARQELQAIL